MGEEKDGSVSDISLVKILSYGLTLVTKSTFQ